MKPHNIVAIQSDTPLAAGATYTSSSFPCYTHDSLIVALKTDQASTLYVDFSVNGSDWDSTLTFSVTAGENEVHRISVARAVARIRVTNNSGSPQTYLRLQTILSSAAQISSAVNSQISQDADALTVRALTFESVVAEGKADGRDIINKFGRNPDIDTATVPEDIWNGGGVYAGFPTGAPEEFQVFSSSASDTGTIVFTYLPSSASTEWLTATATLNGTTPVNTGITGYRMHTANYNSGSSTGFNVGEITIRHRTTTANVFCVMPIGRSQTNVAAYTVPAGHRGYIKRFFVRVYGTSTDRVSGGLWVRSPGSGPRLRRSFTAGSTDHFEEMPYGGLEFLAGSDIAVRIISASANNLEVTAGFDIEIVKE